MSDGIFLIIPRSATSCCPKLRDNCLAFATACGRIYYPVSCGELGPALGAAKCQSLAASVSLFPVTASGNHVPTVGSVPGVCLPCRPHSFHPLPSLVRLCLCTFDRRECQAPWLVTSMPPPQHPLSCLRITVAPTIHGRTGIYHYAARQLGYASTSSHYQLNDQADGKLVWRAAEVKMPGCSYMNRVRHCCQHLNPRSSFDDISQYTSCRILRSLKFTPGSICSAP